MSALSSACDVQHTSFLFFFLMIRRPPRSTLFPTRRSSDLPPWCSPARRPPCTGWRGAGASTGRRWSCPRSEEHTSELQSQSNLVCRLLLEKKKLEACDAASLRKSPDGRHTVLPHADMPAVI